LGIGAVIRRLKAVQTLKNNPDLLMLMTDRDWWEMIVDKKMVKKSSNNIYKIILSSSK
jgi:hypothetical protein